MKDLIKEDYKPWTDANAVLEEKLEELGFQRSGKAVYSEVSKSLFEENQKNKTNIFNTSVRKVGESFGEGYHNISIIEEYWQNDEEKQFFNKIFEKRSAYAYKLRKEMAQKKKEEFNF